ncbi:non-specific serine,threonine protein kinase, partial [Sarracenia purpurea var. burkii]
MALSEENIDTKHPISGKGGVLEFGNNGNLMVLDGNGNSVWSNNASALTNSTTAVLMDTGNLILSSSDNVGDINKALWQSFNDPTDTYLPDMRIYVNSMAGENRVFSSWKSANDPSLGRYSMGVDPRASPQIVIWDGPNRRWRSGHWNGLIFTGVPNMRAIYLYGFKLFNKGNGNLYFTYTSWNSSDLLRFRIRWDGNEEQLWWDEGRNEWGLVQLQPANECEVYNKCGVFGICSETESPICSCIEGFVPQHMDQWDGGDWSGGCVRQTQLQCGRNDTGTVVVEDGERDRFMKIEGVKLPDFADLVVARGIKDCEDKCLKNCSCHAYAFVSGIDCIMWNGDLIDIQHFAEGGNQLYVRLASSEFGKKNLMVLI